MLVKQDPLAVGVHLLINIEDIIGNLIQIWGPVLWIRLLAIRGPVLWIRPSPVARRRRWQEEEQDGERKEESSYIFCSQYWELVYLEGFRWGFVPDMALGKITLLIGA
ncbi:hypothetical protein SOVF_209730, partial [Spinacia oleracea]